MDRNQINWIVLGVVLVVAAAGLYSQYQSTRPCTHPIPYAFGAVDTRFGITNAMLMNDAKAAAAVWNTAVGKNLFIYDAAAHLKIHLIYDEREATAKLGNEITLQQSTQDEERVRLDVLQAQFVASQAAYNEQVGAINARGGAKPREAQTLTLERDSLNTLAQTINARVANYNANVVTLNTIIKEFNQSAGRTFEEGQYVRDSSGERINIFEFIGDSQLQRVLAHEFGHAIGIDHNDDPKSIMFAKNESGNLVPTPSDLAALRAVCGT